MGYTTNQFGIVLEPFENLWFSLVSVLPQIIGALLFFLIGLLLASAISVIVRHAVRLTQIDKLTENLGIQEIMSRFGKNASISSFLAWAVKWFIILGVLLGVADILQWQEVTEFLRSIALYIPRVIVAVIILIIGVVAAEFVHGVIEKGVKASRVAASISKMAASFAKWAIIVVTFMAGLSQLGIAEDLITVLLSGFVLALSLAFGLAFGLGGKERAAKWLENLEKEMR